MGFTLLLLQKKKKRSQVFPRPPRWAFLISSIQTLFFQATFVSPDAFCQRNDFCIVKTKGLAQECSLLSRLNSGFRLLVGLCTMTTQSVGITNMLGPGYSLIADILMKAALQKLQHRNFSQAVILFVSDRITVNPSLVTVYFQCQCSKQVNSPACCCLEYQSELWIWVFLYLRYRSAPKWSM